jgi:molybdopterin converting factor small subunit
VALINGRHVTLDQVLSDGETVSLFPKVGGG